MASGRCTRERRRPQLDQLAPRLQRFAPRLFQLIGKNRPLANLPPAKRALLYTPWQAVLAACQGDDFMEAALEVSGVTKTFGENRAVDDLSLVVPRGSTYGIIGPSGAGK